MSVQFTVENTRGSEYLILPSAIKFNPSLNGRHELPDIEWLVESWTIIAGSRSLGYLEVAEALKEYGWVPTVVLSGA